MGYYQNSIIVLGMHRSGSANTTEMLRYLGVVLEEKLTAGHAQLSNIANADEEALLSLGAAWDDILLKPSEWWKAPELKPFAEKIKRYLKKDFALKELWAVEDPRMCRLLPWWLTLFADLGVKTHYLIVLHPPHEIYLTVKNQDGFSLEKAYLLWLLHYLDAEFWTRDLRRAFVTFEQLVKEPVATLAEVEKKLTIRFPIPVTEASEALAAFNAKNAGHHVRSLMPAETGSDLVQWANELYTHLVKATTDNQNFPDKKRLNEIRSDVECFQKSFPPLLTEQLRNSYKTRLDLQLTLNKMLRSRSWRASKPIRVIERFLGKDD
jgi:hypothetical protein